MIYISLLIAILVVVASTLTCTIKNFFETKSVEEKVNQKFLDCCTQSRKNYYELGRCHALREVAMKCHYVDPSTISLADKFVSRDKFISKTELLKIIEKENVK